MGVAVLTAALLAGVWVALELDVSLVADRSGAEPALARFGGDFSLSGADGRWSLSDERGRVVLLFFGYTTCPDVCPTTLATMASAFKQLSETERAAVRGIFVSVDPDRDSAAQTHDYAQRFDARIIGLTGSHEELQRITRQYGALYMRSQTETAAGYLVDHSASTYVIGPDGRLLERLGYADSAGDLARKLRSIIDEMGVRARIG